MFLLDNLEHAKSLLLKRKENPQKRGNASALPHFIKKKKSAHLGIRPSGLALKALPPGPVLGLTSQVSQRPQQASVVIRRPLQPGFLATNVNSRTAQPTKVPRFPPEVLRTQQQPARRRRAMGPRKRYASFMLFCQRGKGKSSLTDPAALHGAANNVWVAIKGTLLLAFQKK